MSKFETESLFKQSYYQFHNYYFLVVVVDVVNIFKDPHQRGQAVSKDAAEQVV